MTGRCPKPTRLKAFWNIDLRLAKKISSADPSSCCGARPSPWRERLRRWSTAATRSGRFFRLGCPISSLLINQLRQLSTPAHTYAPLYLPLAARSNVAATGGAPIAPHFDTSPYITWVIIPSLDGKIKAFSPAP